MPSDQFIREIRDEIADLKRQVDHLIARPALGARDFQVRLAKTVQDPNTSTYPSSGNTFWVVFLDGFYYKDDGQQTPTYLQRQPDDAALALTHNVGPTPYIPEGTEIEVWFQNGQWWANYGGAVYEMYELTGKVTWNDPAKCLRAPAKPVPFDAAPSTYPLPMDEEASEEYIYFPNTYWNYTVGDGYLSGAAVVGSRYFTVWNHGRREVLFACADNTRWLRSFNVDYEYSVPAYSIAVLSVANGNNTAWGNIPSQVDLRQMGTGELDDSKLYVVTWGH